jgi:hypothetical protein
MLDWGNQELELDAKQWLVGTNIAFRTETIRQLGGFRVDLGRLATLPLADEELELSLRLRRRGFSICYSPEIKVSHLVMPERLHRHWFRQRAFWQGISHVLVYGDDSQYQPSVKRVEDLLSTGANANDQIMDILMEDTDDPERFFMQCATMRALGILLHSGKLPTVVDSSP